MSPLEVSIVIVRVANMVFGQNWIIHKERGNADLEDEDQDLEINEESNELRDPTSMMPEVFPSRQTIT